MGKSITDLSSVTTVGLDLAKHVFQVHGAQYDRVAAADMPTVAGVVDAASLAARIRQMAPDFAIVETVASRWKKHFNLSAEAALIARYGTEKIIGGGR
jgi:hypothetical protein